VSPGYDLTLIRRRIRDLGAWLAVGSARSEPDAHARRCASYSVDAIDAALRDLHDLRAALVAEIREADDASAARADELLCVAVIRQPPRPPHDLRCLQETTGPRALNERSRSRCTPSSTTGPTLLPRGR
jgi:hypothetical protein